MDLTMGTSIQANLPKPTHLEPHLRNSISKAAIEREINISIRCYMKCKDGALEFLPMGCFMRTRELRCYMKCKDGVLDFLPMGCFMRTRELD